MCIKLNQGNEAKEVSHRPNCLISTFSLKNYCLKNAQKYNRNISMFLVPHCGFYSGTFVPNIKPLPSLLAAHSSENMGTIWLMMKCRSSWQNQTPAGHSFPARKFLGFPVDGFMGLVTLRQNPFGSSVTKDFWQWFKALEYLKTLKFHSGAMLICYCLVFLSKFQWPLLLDF